MTALDPSAVAPTGATMSGVEVTTTVRGQDFTFEPGGWRSHYERYRVGYTVDEESLLEAMRTIEYGEEEGSMAGVGVVLPDGRLIPYCGGSIVIDGETFTIDQLEADEDAAEYAEAQAYWRSLTDEERAGALRVGEALREKPVDDPAAAGLYALRQWVRAWRAAMSEE